MENNNTTIDDPILAMGTVRLNPGAGGKSVSFQMSELVELASSRFRSERYSGLHDHRIAHPAAALPEVNGNFGEAFMPLLRDAIDEVAGLMRAYVRAPSFDSTDGCTLTLRDSVAGAENIRVFCLLLRHSLSLAGSVMRRRAGVWDSEDAARLDEERMNLKEYMITRTSGDVIAR